MKKCVYPDVQEPGCTTGVDQQIGNDWKVDQAIKAGVDD